jgi:Fe-S-cluster containining protein
MTINRVTVPEEQVKGPDSVRFFELRNGNLGPDGKVRFVTHGFAPCSQHDVVAAKCKVYDTRPDVCKMFPTVPDQIEGTPCTYWFEAVDENDVVQERRGGLGSPYPSPPRFKS